MRTETINIYSFSELSEEAKGKAIENFRNKYHDYQFYFDEIIDTVKKVVDLFNLKTGRQWDDLRTSHLEDNITELKGLRLRTYLINNYWGSLYERKYLGCIGDNRVINHRMSNTRYYDMKKGARVNSTNFIYSNVQFTNDCTLTGVCFDNEILQPVYDFLKKPCPSTTFEDLMQEIGDAISKAFRDTEEWVNSDEFITDHMEASGYEFEEDGSLY